MADKNTTNANSYLAFDTDANQVPVLLKESFLPAYYRSTGYTTTSQLTDGSTPAGQAFVSVLGNVTSTFPIGLIISFSNVVGTPTYRVTSATFGSTITNVGFTPALVTTVPGNTLIYTVSVTRTRYTDLSIDTSINGSVASNILSLGVNPAFVEGIIDTDIGVAGTTPSATYINTGGQVSSFTNATGTFVVPQASQASVVTALLNLANGIVQNSSGNWILPIYQIFVAFSSSPGTTQTGTISAITQNSSLNQLSLVISNTANFPFFNSATYPANLFINLFKFTFVPLVQTEVGRLGQANDFGLRDDVTYWCITNDNNGFVGLITSDQVPAILSITTAIRDGTYLQNSPLTFLGTVPASFIDGTPVVVFSRNADFNITVAILDVTGANYDVAGEFNSFPGTVFPVGSYAVTVCRAAPIQTLNTLVGAANIVSSDGSVSITTSPGTNTINLRGASGGGGGSGVQGINVGEVIQSNILTYTGDNGNEAYGQVGSGSGYSTNTAVIDPGTTTNGWRFNGGQTRDLIQSVVVQLGAQRQRFRFVFNGPWNSQTWGAYSDVGSFQQYVLREPVFARSNYPWEDNLDGIFPGFRQDPNVPGPSWQGLLPLTPVTYVPNRTNASGLRWSPNAGYLPTQGRQGPLTVYLNAQGFSCVNVPIATSISYTAGQAVTCPFKFAGSNRYVGAEFSIDVSGSGTSIPVRLAEGIGAGLTVDQDLWPVDADRNLIIWNSGQPSTTSQTNALLEIWLESNSWVADSTVTWPNGFPFTDATKAAARYNFTHTAENPVGVSFASLDWRVFNQNEDSPLSPQALATWNNRITVNIGAPTELIRWGDFATSCRYNTGQTPVTGVLVTFGATVVTGTVHYYFQYTASDVSVAVYRFVPNTDSALTDLSYDSFWRTFTNNTTLATLIIQRGQI